MASEPRHQKIGGGRRKGVPNKATTVVRELARRLVQDPKYLREPSAATEAWRSGEHGPMLWNHAYGRPTEPRDTTNALPISNYGEMLRKFGRSRPTIAARREQVLAELRAEEELRANRSETS